MGRARIRAPEQPQWAVILWPEHGAGCIPLEDVATATARGAIVIASEADLLPWPTSSPVMIAQSNPRRVAGD